VADSAVGIQAKGSLALVKQEGEILVFEETSAWNLLDRFAIPTEAGGGPSALQGEEIFLGTPLSNGEGSERGEVILYSPRVNTVPLLTLKGGKKLSITGPKAKLSGSVSDDVPGSLVEASYRSGKRTLRKRIPVSATGQWKTTLTVGSGTTKVTLTATDSDGAKSRPVKVKIRRP
jgi:hypothetical protein